MSAFGKRGSMTNGAKPVFGVARAMQGDSSGGQFPPIDLNPFPEIDPFANLPGFDSPAEDDGIERSAGHLDALARLDVRTNASGEAGRSQVEGFEASIHKIKEQVLPRLLERVDPEAAATLSKDELAEEFRPIIGEVLAELRITFSSANSSRSKRCWSMNYSGSGRSRNCSAIR